MPNRFVNFLFFSIFLISYAASYATPEIKIELVSSAVQDKKLFDCLLKEPAWIEKIICKSDIIISEQELLHLGPLREHAYVTKQELAQFCSHVAKKNKFEYINFAVTPGKVGLILTVNLVANWTFKKLQFKTSLPDKERYQHAYFLRIGEVFDLDKHAYALEKLREELKNAGYLCAKISDVIDRDEQTKEISVLLNIDHGERFTISTIITEMRFEDKTKSALLDSLSKQVSKLLQENYAGGYFERDSSEELEAELKKFLIESGYLSFEVIVNPVINNFINTVMLTITVTICEKKRFKFMGNTVFSAEQLITELCKQDISNGVPPALVLDDIGELYKKKGFLSVEVDLEETEDELLFKITENEQVKISQIIIAGDVFGTKKDIIERLFSDFLKQKIYQEDLLAVSLEKWESESIKLGFWDFKIVKRDLVPTDQKNIYSLVLTVSLGTRRMLTNMSVSSFPEIMQEPLFAPYKNLPGPIPFDMQLIHEQQIWIVNYLKRKGFLYSTVKPELKFGTDGVALIWNIDLNIGQVRFGKTVIEGTSRINSQVLLRELAYTEGEPFDQAKIEASVKKIKSLGIFESVSLAPHSNEPEVAQSMLLRFTQDFPFEVRTRLGYQQVSKSFTHQSGSTYTVGGTFMWKNPAGLADNLRFDGDITRFTRDISVQYELPWIFNQPIRTIFKLYSGVFEQPLFTTSRHNLYKVHDHGICIDFNSYITGGNMHISVGSEIKKISGLSPDLARIIDFKADLIDKRILYLFAEPTVTWCTLDNKLDPSQGSSAVLTAKSAWAPTKTEASFLKIGGEYSYFRPLYRNHVIGALRFAAGHVFAHNLNTIMPTDRFYLGGAYSLRGYEPDMVPPLNSFACTEEQLCWAPIGGKTMANINAELRFGIYNNLSGVIFTDIGALSHTKFSDIFGQNIYGATGFGLRYSTPIGPIRFDIGWKWKKRIPEDKSYAWFLTFGHAF